MSTLAVLDQQAMQEENIVWMETKIISSEYRSWYIWYKCNTCKTEDNSGGEILQGNGLPI